MAYLNNVKVMGEAEEIKSRYPPSDGLPEQQNIMDPKLAVINVATHLPMAYLNNHEGDKSWSI